MPFVNLNRRIDRQSRIARKAPKRSFFKIMMRILIVLIILVVVVYIPVRGVYSSAKTIIASARAINDSLKRENLDDIRANITAMKKADDSLNFNLNLLIWARVIPFAGNYYGDARHFAKASQYELSAAQTITDSLDPFKSELGFTGTPTPGVDRVAQLVKILNKVIPNLPKVEPQLKSASDEVASIDVNKYPETFGKYHLRAQIDAAKSFIQGADYAVTQAKPALEIAPSALGEPTPKNYFLIFQNDKELRATGGFMTAYAKMTLDKGHIDSSQSDDIYRLDEQMLDVCKSKVCPLTPPDPIAKYLPEADGKPRTAWSMRDSNLSPDLPTSMQTFEKMYSYLGNGVPWDGIITIDTHVVEDLIRITGPIEVYGTKYSADTDSRCNCPNVIYELEAYSQIIEKGEKDRKAILGALMQQLLAKSLSASTDRLPEFINTGIKLAQAKHIMFYMHDQKTEQALQSLDWTGQILPSVGDYLHINDSNFAGGKSNLYLTEDVTMEIDSKTGHHKLTINYKNPQPFGIWLNGINRDYVRIYTPQGSKLTANKGSDVKVNTFDELGKTVFDAFIQTRPQNSRTLVFEYDAPIQNGSSYPILVQKQPGTQDFSYTIKINGSTKANFNLSSDQDLKL